MKTTTIITIFSITIILTTITTVAAQTDQTLISGNKGIEVINAVADKIQSWCLLPDFRNLLKLIPFLQLNDVDNQPDTTLESNQFHGLWKIEKEQFDFVKSSLKGVLLKDIEDSLPVKWSKVTLKDMKIPIVGGTFAALTLYFRSGKVRVIPAVSRKLEEFFLKNYRIDQYPSKPFLPKIQSAVGRLEVLFMADGTSKVSQGSFKSVKTGMADITQDFYNSINKDSTPSLKVAFTQYTSTLKHEIILGERFDQDNPYERMKTITQVNTNEEANMELALEGIRDSFREARGIEQGREEVIKGDGEMQGVARVAVLITPGFKQEDIPKILKARDALRDDHINLLVFTVEGGTKVEYEKIGGLQDQVCKDSYLTEGFSTTSELDGYLTASIAQNAFVWVPIGRPVVFRGLSIWRGIRVKLDTDQEGITIHIKSEKLNANDAIDPKIIATFYISSSNIAPSAAYNDRESITYLGRESVTSVGYNGQAITHGAVKGLLTLSSKSDNIKVTISTRPGRDCSTSPCQNQGTCNMIDTDYVCQCTEAFKGKDCEIKRGKKDGKKDACIGNPCSDRQTCIALDQGKHQCQCKLGFTGKDCETKTEEKKDEKENKDACIGNPCSDRQTCTALDQGKYKCQCKLGFKGLDCKQKMRSCDEIKCQNGGTCVGEEGKVVCKCMPSYTGNDCSIKDRKGGAGQLAPPLLLSIILSLIAMKVVY